MAKTKKSENVNQRRRYKLRVVLELPMDREGFSTDELADVSASLAAITATQDSLCFAEMLRVLSEHLKKQSAMRPRLLSASLKTGGGLLIDVPRVVDKARKTRRSIYRPTPADRELYRERYRDGDEVLEKFVPGYKKGKV